MGDSNQALDVLLHQYDHALHVAQFADTSSWEVASIIWGANTLILGFILEVRCAPENQWLVMVAAVVGIFMSLYVPFVQYLTKKGQSVAYAICRDIERESALTHRLHTRINEIYPKKRGQAAIWVLTGIFIGAWCWNIHHAWACLHYRAS